MYQEYAIADAVLEDLERTIVNRTMGLEADHQYLIINGLYIVAESVSPIEFHYIIANDDVEYVTIDRVEMMEWIVEDCLLQ